jgi:hypothetical protein
MDYNEEYLTEEQKVWFGNRMTESPTGRIIVPTRLYDKFRKITDNEFLKNHEIKCWLIDNCY